MTTSGPDNFLKCRFLTNRCAYILAISTKIFFGHTKSDFPSFIHKLAASFGDTANIKLTARNYMTIDTLTNPIFKIAKAKMEVICPPDQVFINSKFAFRLTIGGHLTDGNDDYQNLMSLLKELGETEFYVLENIGATLTERDVPFQATILVESDFNYFDNVVKNFDSPFGFLINHFFVFGKNDNWGIYVCEHPTINIIGCSTELADKFSKVFNIDGNGFKELEEFIKNEYQKKPELFSLLTKNYKLIDG